MRSPLTTTALGLLLLLSAAFAFVSDIPRHKIRRSAPLSPVKLQEKPDSISQDVPRYTNRRLIPSRKRGERRRRLREIVHRVIPKKRNIARIAIAVMVYLRGPSILATNGDPNVAHAGVTVKFSGARVEATIKDIPPLLPPKTIQSLTPKVAEKAPMKSAKSNSIKNVKKALAPVSKFAKRVAASDIPNFVTSEPGSLMIASGGGIVAAAYSRRKDSGVKNGSDVGSTEEKAREAQTQEYVKNILESQAAEDQDA